MILGHVMSGLCSKMNRTKQLPADVMETPLNRCLNTFDITLLGIFLNENLNFDVDRLKVRSLRFIFKENYA